MTQRDAGGDATGIVVRNAADPLRLLVNPLGKPVLPEAEYGRAHDGAVRGGAARAFLPHPARNRGRIAQIRRVAKNAGRGLTHAHAAGERPVAQARGDVALVDHPRCEQAVEDAQHLVGVVRPVATIPVRAVVVADDIAVVAQAARVVLDNLRPGKEFGAQSECVAHGLAVQNTAEFVRC